jgi:hypothetical protein
VAVDAIRDSWFFRDFSDVIMRGRQLTHHKEEGLRGWSLFGWASFGGDAPKQKNPANSMKIHNPCKIKPENNS